MSCFFRFFRVVPLLITSFLPVMLGAQDGRLGLNTVVIDPGHGGNDPGCISKDRKTKEKDLTLDISKRLAGKIRAEYPEMKVLQTRNTDVFIPLVQRAQIANSAHANLFISIHINATTGTAANGYSVHVLGQSSKKGRDLYSNNFNECARENSVILLEDDYSTNYQGFDPNDPESSILFSLMQNAYLEQSLMFADDVNRALKPGPFRTSRGVHQDPFLVLWKTAMPSVLIECGFISNLNDLSALRSASKLDEIAEGIFKAFKQFKTDYDRSLNVTIPQSTQTTSAKPSEPETSKASERPAVEEAPATSDGPWFGTQILALSRKLADDDPAFLGQKVTVVRDGNIYRYIVGCSTDRKEALAESRVLKKSFPDSFLVRVDQEGKVERCRTASKLDR